VTGEAQGTCRRVGCPDFGKPIPEGDDRSWHALETGEAQGISEQDRQQWWELADAATPGPWELTPSGVILGPPHRVHQLAQWVVQLVDLIHDHDAEFIAAARTAVPALLAALADRDRELAELRAKIAAVELDCRTALLYTPNSASVMAQQRLAIGVLRDLGCEFDAAAYSARLAASSGSAPTGQEER
jgi:hypothetical protein